MEGGTRRERGGRGGTGGGRGEFNVQMLKFCVHKARTALRREEVDKGSIWAGEGGEGVRGGRERCLPPVHPLSYGNGII